MQNGYKALKRIVATTAVVAVAACFAVLPSSAQAGRPLPGTHVDPLSFTGPNPADQFKEIFIEQKLDSQVPFDLPFRDETGKEVTLAEIANGKPMILGLVYYRCPNACTAILSAMVSVIDAAALNLQLGEEFQVVALSIDPREMPELATEKKKTYGELYHRDGWDNGFHFLTGNEENIERVASAVGYRYYYDKATDQYAHASGVMVITPDGKVSSYYLGTEYLPKKMQFALMDAADGNIGALVDQLVLLCFAYDPTVGAYGFYIINAVRLVAAFVVLALVTFWIAMWLRDRRNSEGPPLDPTDQPIAS